MKKQWKISLLVLAVLVVLAVASVLIFGFSFGVEANGGCTAVFEMGGEYDASRIWQITSETEGITGEILIQTSVEGNRVIIKSEVNRDADEVIKTLDENIKKEYPNANFAHGGVLSAQVGGLETGLILLASVVMLVAVFIIAAIRYGLSGGYSLVLSILAVLVALVSATLLTRVKLNTSMVAVLAFAVLYVIYDSVVLFERCIATVGATDMRQNTVEAAVTNGVKDAKLLSLLPALFGGVAVVLLIALGSSAVQTLAVPIGLAIVLSVLISRFFAVPLWALHSKKLNETKKKVKSIR